MTTLALPRLRVRFRRPKPRPPWWWSALRWVVFGGACLAFLLVGFLRSRDVYYAIAAAGMACWVSIDWTKDHPPDVDPDFRASAGRWAIAGFGFWVASFAFIPITVTI